MFNNKEGQKLMSIKIGNLDLFKELINSMVNIDTILNVLARKGIITQEEFDAVKKEAVEIFKKKYPDLFIEKPKG